MPDEELSPRFKELFRKMRNMNYGSIANLELQDGEPLFTDATRITREVAFQKQPPRSPQPSTYRHKPQVDALVRQFQQLRNGTIKLIRVQEGLPFRMQIEE